MCVGHRSAHCMYICMYTFGNVGSNFVSNNGCYACAYRFSTVSLYKSSVEDYKATCPFFVILRYSKLKVCKIPRFKLMGPNFLFEHFCVALYLGSHVIWYGSEFTVRCSTFVFLNNNGGGHRAA